MTADSYKNTSLCPAPHNFTEAINIIYVYVCQIK